MTCVLIRNVDDQVSQAVIAQKMMEFGIVINVRVLKDRQGNSKGMGYVFYAEAKGANNACKHSGCTLGTKKMIIEPIKRKNSATSPNRTVKKAREVKAAKPAKSDDQSFRRFAVTQTRDNKLSIQQKELKSFFTKAYGPELAKEIIAPYLDSLRSFDEYNLQFSNYLAKFQECENSAQELSKAYLESRICELNADSFADDAAIEKMDIDESPNFDKTPPLEMTPPPCDTPSPSRTQTSFSQQELDSAEKYPPQEE